MLTASSWARSRFAWCEGLTTQAASKTVDPAAFNLDHVNERRSLTAQRPGIDSTGVRRTKTLNQF